MPVDLLYYNNVYFFKSAGVFRYASGSYTISTDSKLGDISFTFSSLQFRPVYIVIEVTNQLSERGQYQDNVYLTPRGAEYCFKESRVYISKGRHNEKYFNALGIFDCTFETTDRGFTWKLPAPTVL